MAEILLQRHPNQRRLLSREEEVELARELRGGDRRARDRFVTSNIGLVIAEARKHAGRGVDLDDLISEGCIGLIVAVDRFDPARGCRFSTYALYWIRHHLREAVQEQPGAMRIPRRNDDARIARAERELFQELERHPTVEEVAGHAEVLATTVTDYRAVVRRHSVPLDAPASDDSDQTVGDLIADESAVAPDAACEDAERTKSVEQSLNILTPRERQVICMRYGLGLTKEYTLAEVGADFHLSRERVRQIQREAMMKLRHPSRRLQEFLGLVPRVARPRPARAPAPALRKAARRKTRRATRRGAR